MTTSSDTPDLQQPWFFAACQFTNTLVESLGEDSDEDTLELFVRHARMAARASSAAIYLPSLGGVWICEVMDGSSPDRQIGSVFDLPRDMRPLLCDNTPVAIGSCLYVPVRGAASLQGALVLDRGEDSEGFTEAEKALALAFAHQGELALELLRSHRGQDAILVAEERERISRDLHDFGIQHLFATGMLLQNLYQRIDSEGGALLARSIKESLKLAMEQLDEAVSQIRRVVYQLQYFDDPAGITEALEREASAARSHLGFAPTLIFEIDNELVIPGSHHDSWAREEFPRRISGQLAEDIVAVVREALTNVSRHAHARSVQVRVSVFGSGPTGEVEVMIVDDGAGVDPSLSRTSGLANMQRRAVLHRGTFAVSAGPRGRGTSLVWRTPLGPS